MIGEIFGNGKSRHGGNLFLPHKPHRLVAQLIGMIDRDNARARGIERAWLAGGMDRDSLAYAGRLVHRRSKLGFGVLIRCGEFSVSERIAPGLVDLDEVGAQLKLLADHAHQLGGVVGIGRVRQNMLLGIEAVRVFMAAQDIDRIAADAEARAGNQALVDGVADGRISGAGAFRSHIALGGEARHQVVTSGQRGDDSSLRHRFFDGLQVLFAGMQKQMHVDVDQAGHQRLVAQIDRFRAGRMRHRRAGFRDAFTFDQYFAGGEKFSTFDIEQARGVQHHGRPLGEDRASHQDDQNRQTLHALTPRFASSSTPSSSVWYCFSRCSLAASKRITRTG